MQAETSPINFDAQLLAELLTFDPLCFVDDIIDVAHACVLKSAERLEDALRDEPLAEGDRDQGALGYETLLTSTADTIWDKWELLALRSVFMIPQTLKIQPPHRPMPVHPFTQEQDSLLDEQLQQARCRIVALRKVNRKGEHMSRTAERELNRLQKRAHDTHRIKSLFKQYESTLDGHVARLLANVSTHAAGVQKLVRDTTLASLATTSAHVNSKVQDFVRCEWERHIASSTATTPHALGDGRDKTVIPSDATLSLLLQGLNSVNETPLSGGSDLASV